MKEALHITSGDCAGSSLAKAGLPGDVFVWHDVLYDGPARPLGWPRSEGAVIRRRKYLHVWRPVIRHRNFGAIPHCGQKLMSWQTANRH
jgi:hypothetical protein